MPVDWIDFKELRQQLSIAQVLAHYRVSIRQKADQGSGFCPLPTHQPARGTQRKRSPSFSVNFAKNVWQCFGCGASGNVLDLACRLEGLDPGDGDNVRQVALELARTFGLDTERPRRAQKRIDHTDADAQPKKDQQALETPADRGWAEGGAAHRGIANDTVSDVVVNSILDFELKNLDSSHPYLLQRGFTEETIQRFGLGFCSRGVMKDRIAIPIHDPQGCLLAYAGRLVDDQLIDAEHPKYLFPGPRERNGKRLEFHKSLVVYNLNRLEQRPLDHLIVVEGFPSVWWLSQHGHANVVAVMGSTASADQLRLIETSVTPAGTVWILPDGDEAGTRCAQSLLALSSERSVRWLKLDPGEQPTDLSGHELESLLPSPTAG